MNYIELQLEFDSQKISTDILIAQLNSIGYESFVEETNCILAYIPTQSFSEKRIKDIPTICSSEKRITYSYKEIKEQNWNATWEKNYSPVTIGSCYIRAPFHPALPSSKYDIVIEPQMSFGTAHHETTALMIEYLLSMKLKNKKVLDMGCGTAVLAILAAKMGANPVVAIDNDDWAFRNAQDNVKKNALQIIEVLFGDVTTLASQQQVDVFLANINRNVLQKDLPAYARTLKHGGYLLLSGFYESDIPLLLQTAEENNLKEFQRKIKNNWAAIQLIKQ